jgi:aminoglycoside 3-N-acetyltransferase
MYETIWNTAADHLSSDRMQADVAEFFQESRWSSFDHINTLAQQIAGKLEAIGMEVELLEFPADGKTCYGGWKLPKAYDVDSARLVALSDEGEGEILADYRENPTCLILYSQPTPLEGVAAEVVIADSIAEVVSDRVSGRLVLTSQMGIPFSRAIQKAGGLGMISDHGPPFGPRQISSGREYLNRVNRWHNYTIPPWDEPNKGFGFALSAEQGKRLRSRIAIGETVRLKAMVETRHYDGVLPLVSGRLRGKLAEEIAIVGHFDEFGADDNCSELAVGLESVRAILAMLKAGQLPPLKRSVRVLFPMEVRGFNALVQDPAQTEHLKAGLNIDTVGTDQLRMSSSCCLVESFPALPSCVDELAVELLERVQQNNEFFRFNRMLVDSVDNIFGEPLIGAPTPVIYHFGDTHHMSQDTPEMLCPQMLQDMARVTTTYVAFLASAGVKEVSWLAELAADRGLQRILQTSAKTLCDANGPRVIKEVEFLRQRYRAKVNSARSLVPACDGYPDQALPANVEESSREVALLPSMALQERLADVEKRIDLFASQTVEQICSRANDYYQFNLDGQLPGALESRCVPVKNFRGFLSFDDLDEAQRQCLEQLGISIGWAAPIWLMTALTFANGKRTVGDIAFLLDLHGICELEVDRLEAIFEFLATLGHVRFRPYLTAEQLHQALGEVGLSAGDMVLGHFSLSQMGYVEGGADTVIDTILQVLGPEGTLMMPTFTFSWLGQLPYDCENSRSHVGAITDRFWRRPGVLRSRHPTHSFAACGKHASHLLEGHDGTQPPIGKQGPIGKLYQLDGKILMLCDLDSNTAMHAGEYWEGIPYVDLVCHTIDQGHCRKVLTPDCPYHAVFGKAYDQLYARGQINDIPLGESEIHLMHCRDAIKAQAEVARQDPEHLIVAGCGCTYCQGVQAFCRQQSHN